MSITPIKQPIIPRVKRESMIKLLNRGERIDGRRLEDFRRINVVLNPLKKAEGSALVKMGNTTVMSGIKMEIGSPFPDQPGEGVLQVHAEFVPLASPTFEPGPPDEDAIETARVIDRSLREPKVIKLDELVLIPGKKVWIVYDDLYLLDHDGNIIDAGMLASILALNTAKIPEAIVESEDKITVNYENRVKPLPLNINVVTVTIGVYSDILLVDPSLDEESILDCKLVFAVDEKNRIVGLQKMGMKGVKSTLYENAMDLALRKAGELFEIIRKVLNNPQDYIKESLTIESIWER